MKIAFCLYRYFPHGGLQRDFFRIANECLRRGHEVQVFAGEWEGEPLPGHDAITTVATKGLTNHARCWDFANKLQPLLASGHFDAVVGFNKLPGLAFYYAADTCFMARYATGWRRLLRLGSRYRTMVSLERAVFASAASTQILLISPREKSRFQVCYGTPDRRFHELSPGIERNRLAPPDAADIRRVVREGLALEQSEMILLLVGSAFRTKGVDRALRALAALPPSRLECTRLVVVGRGDERKYVCLAKRLGVAGRVRFLGGRDDIPRLLLAADLLVHPARTENTGTVLLEALCAGLPVMASATCGYGEHVTAAGAGQLVPEPFCQARFDQMLTVFLERHDLAMLGKNARDYAARTDLFSMVEQAVDLIEKLAKRIETDA